jgi:hypothetical protein
MPNLNNLIITAKEYKCALNIPGVATFPLLTLSEVNWDEKAETETFHSVGNSDPIGVKSNANSYNCKFTLQEGEYAILLKVLGINSAIEIPTATLAVVGLSNLNSYTFKNIVFGGAAMSVKNKDKETLRVLEATVLKIIYV